MLISAGFTPAARTRISTSLGPTSGIGNSINWRRSDPPYSSITIARIVGSFHKKGEAKQTLLHPTRVSPPHPIFSPGGVPPLLLRLLLPQRACWQQRPILAALS